VTKHHKLLAWSGWGAFALLAFLLLLNVFAERPPSAETCRQCVTAHPSASASAEPTSTQRDWQFTYDTDIFSSSTKDCLPAPDRKPPTETRGGCVVSPRRSFTADASWICGDWTVELREVHARAGIARVSADMHYAGAAGDPGVCQLSFRGTAEVAK
jgi:hypothetical protein